MILAHGAATVTIPQWPDLSGLWMSIAAALLFLCLLMLFAEKN